MRWGRHRQRPPSGLQATRPGRIPLPLDIRQQLLEFGLAVDQAEDRLLTLDGALLRSPRRRSGCQEPFEERTVALEGGSEIIGGDVVAPVPLVLQPAPLIGEGAGEVLHELGDQPVGPLDRLPWRVDKAGLDVGPASPEANNGPAVDVVSAAPLSGATWAAGAPLGTGASSWSTPTSAAPSWSCRSGSRPGSTSATRSSRTAASRGRSSGRRSSRPGSSAVTSRRSKPVPSVRSGGAVSVGC
jgi:hypothetical protein